MAEHRLNCEGLRCPMPIVEVFKKFSSLNIGDTLIISSDDKAFSNDIEAWCARMGQELVSLTSEGSIVSAVIIKLK